MRCRRKTDAEMCNDEHAQQEHPCQPPSKHRRSTAPGPHTEEPHLTPGKTKRGWAAKITSTEQPHGVRKPRRGKWQQYSDIYDAKPKPKSISTWRQLTMHQGKIEKDDKQAAKCDDIWDTEGSQSDDGESVDLQQYPVQHLKWRQQQHAYPQNGNHKHKTSIHGHAGTVIFSSWQAGFKIGKYSR